MALITLATDGADPQPVIGGAISLPRVGVWHAELQVDTDIEDLEGQVVVISVNGGELYLAGVATRALPYEGVTQVHVVAGGGGAQMAATPKFYVNPTAGAVLADLAKDMGTTVSDTADALSDEFTAWTTIAGPVGAQLTELLRPLGAAWRILPDGTLWAGVESWPASDVDPEDWQPTGYDHINGVLDLGMVAPTLLPGTTIGSDLVRIDRVEHVIDAGSVRTRAWVPRDNRLPAAGEVDTLAPRLSRDFAAVGRGSLTPVDFLALYLGTTKSQANQTFDIQPEDGRLPSMSGVPIRHGFPGLTVTVDNGATVLVGWRNGDPREPYCALWGGGETVQSIMMGAANLVAAQHGVVLAKCVDTFTGLPHFALAGTSLTVMAKE